MELEEYLQFVANKIKDSRQKNDYKEVARVLRSCVETLTSKVDEIEAKLGAE